MTKKTQNIWKNIEWKTLKNMGPDNVSLSIYNTIYISLYIIYYLSYILNHISYILYYNFKDYM